ncbi:diphthine--ammonia ligase isoform X2 [Takifugu rubripes]|uniref:diphthine--ammonia ligase isoform X2 n=1 Tax=Takifugu rubripes TaxID=31033 RepID=UPI0011455752|nr:diphthine--ammonia ligase isoform X2 [Takifugu rubripes]
MKVVALISGGKDSCYNMMQCVAAGHQIVALANLRPANTDELDSYMYQTVGHQAIDLYAEAMDLPLYRRIIQGSSLDTSKNYTKTDGDEVEDLYDLLHLVKLSQKYGVHVCGEGGEYETFTLDCPLFKKKIVIDAAETVIHSADAFAPVGYLRFTEMHTESKDGGVVASALPHGSCPCQSAIDKMTEEVEYADQAEDNKQEFTSKCDLSCQPGHSLLPAFSPRSSRGFQWISGIGGFHSQEPGIEGQAFAAFMQLQSELDHRGWKLQDIILVHLYVKSMGDFVPLNAVYKKHFGVNPPARVCVQAPLPAGQLLQMDCLLQAWTEPPEEGCFHERGALHVQSMSHWAPANIGPYSQAVRVDQSVFCSGQIGLVPCTMQLVEAGARAQTLLTLSHVRKVLQAVIASSTLANVVQAHCYATRKRDIGVIREAWESALRAEEEEKGPSWEPRSGPAPLLVVVVPALPKGAAVEFHVTAVQDDSRSTSCHLTTEVPCGSIDWHSVTSAGACGASLSLSLARPVDGLELAAARDATEAIGATFKKATGTMKGALVPLCARAFYKCTHAAARLVVAGLEASLKSILGESCPAVALVPVLDLPDSQILHLSCWLSL